MNRNLKTSQIFGQIYVIFVISFLIFMYYDILRVFKPDLVECNTFTLELFYTLIRKNEIGDQHLFQNLYFIVFNILFFMVSWCLIRTMISDPGKIPLFWGFYFEDPGHTTRRYCLICHIFKPERCHHCSICNRCVLNMDHHCPWLNNCIGFQNRKFFFLLIFYVNVGVWYILGGFIPYIWKIIHNFDHFEIENLWILIPFGILLPFSMVIFGFFIFHYRLITRNMTTLENLDRKRNKLPKNHPSKYDIGFNQNWEQVFGSNKYLWPFPVFGESGKPVGDGVMYRHSSDQNKQNVELKDKLEVSKKTNDQYDEDQNDHDFQMHKNFIPPQFKQNNQLSIYKQTNQDSYDQRSHHIQYNTSHVMNNMKLNQTNQSVLNTSFGRNNGGGNLNSSFNSAQDRPSYYSNRQIK